MTNPMPTQIEDAQFLTRTGNAALWSEPGTGKTLSTILALETARSGAVIAPAVATGMWRRELDRHDLQHVAVHSWGKVPSVNDFPKVDALVLDESQYAVRTTAKRTTAVYGKGRDQQGLVHRAGVVWPLSGTPMLRFADDLWPCLHALFPEHLRFLKVDNWYAFRQRYCELDGLGKIRGSRNSSLRTLNRVLEGHLDPPRVVIRRTLKEVAPFLPPITVREMTYALTSPEARALARVLPPDWQAQLAEAERRLEEGPHMATARRLMSAMKVPLAVDLISDTPEKVIVIFVHTATGQMLQEAIKEPTLMIQGSTPQAQRQPIVDQFNSEGGPRILLGQLHTMGIAINPHERCSHMLFVERDWSAAVLEQAINRVRRLGQTQHQQIDFLDCDHPLDAAMRRVANRKLRSMGVLVGDE